MIKDKVAALVPAHNEQAVISKTLKSLLRQIPAADIYVVDDGSYDDSYSIAKKYTNNVLRIDKNVGKAKALNTVITHFNLVDNYEFIMFMDADTQIGQYFISRCVSHFKKDINEEVACVVGRIQGLGGTWIGKYRLWEYAIAHSVHKRAQAHMHSMLVVPGCATIYRSDIFKNVEIPDGTFTEDMDFTFLLHRSKHTRMVFENNAVVYTQDPQTLASFIKQVNRWYVGFWQAVKKHNLPWHGQNLDFEAALLATEGLFSGISTLILLVLLPVLYFNDQISILRIPFLIDLCIFFLPSLIWASIKTKDYTLILYIVHFYFIRFLTSILFLYNYFRAFLISHQKYTWDTKRFIVKS